MSSTKASGSDATSNSGVGAATAAPAPAAPEKSSKKGGGSKKKAPAGKRRVKKKKPMRRGSSPSHFLMVESDEAKFGASYALELPGRDKSTWGRVPRLCLQRQSEIFPPVHIRLAVM